MSLNLHAKNFLLNSLMVKIKDAIFSFIMAIMIELSLTSEMKVGVLRKIRLGV